MNLPEHSKKETLRAEMFSLVEVCPVEGCNPSDCPFHKLRKMGHARRFEWINALSEADLTDMVAYHHICMNTKLAAMEDAGEGLTAAPPAFCPAR